jgi:hypothetical protein
MKTKTAESLSREGSFDEPLAAAGEDARTADYERPRATDSSSDDEYYSNLPPGRMHATRVPERLSGSTGNLHIPPGLSTILRKKMDAAGGGVGGSSGVGGTPAGHSSSLSPRSRSRSPSVRDKMTTATALTADGNSSISSLDDIVDQDILYDRAGLVELSESDVLSERKRLHSSGRDFTNLPPVCERSSEDMLEDAQAFADPVIVRSSNASRANSIGTGADQFLEPLNEDDEEDDLDDITEEGDFSERETQVIVTNLDNISLSDDHRMAARAGTRGTGESSLMEEAPSVPTA